MVTFQLKKEKKRKKHCFINELVLKVRTSLHVIPVVLLADRS